MQLAVTEGRKITLPEDFKEHEFLVKMHLGMRVASLLLSESAMACLLKGPALESCRLEKALEVFKAWVSRLQNSRSPQEVKMLEACFMDGACNEDMENHLEESGVAESTRELEIDALLAHSTGILWYMHEAAKLSEAYPAWFLGMMLGHSAYRPRKPVGNDG